MHKLGARFFKQQTMDSAYHTSDKTIREDSAYHTSDKTIREDSTYYTSDKTFRQDCLLEPGDKLSMTDALSLNFSQPMVVNPSSLMAQGSKAKNGRTEVWTEKYRPQNIEDLVGNSQQISEIDNWFNAYKNRDPSIKRALLFSGPPGLGKTTLAHAVLIKYGFKVKEYNASDVRSRKLVHKNLYHIIKMGYVDQHSPDFRSFGIIMDEVDGMSSGDTGGMAELISFINPTRGKRSVKKEEKTALSKRWIPPIICICNDNTDKKMKELKKDCQEIVFKKPTKKELRCVIDRVAVNENFKITEEAADLVCGQSQGDYRRLLTILQNLVTIAVNDADDEEIQKGVLLNTDLVMSQTAIFCSKDLDLHLSEKVNGLFNGPSKPEELLKIYVTEKSLLPMMMHENYLDFIPLQVGISDLEKLENIKKTIDSIVLGDIIDKTMYNNQSWHLQEIHGLTSCWVPCYYVNKNKKSAFKRATFTTALGRFSFQRANQKNINGLVRKINRDDTYSLEDIRALSEIILFNLLEPKGNQELGIQYLIEYGLHIDDVKDLIKMNKLESHYSDMHSSRMKTALLKAYTSYVAKQQEALKPKDISADELKHLLSTSANQTVRVKGSGAVINVGQVAGNGSTNTSCSTAVKTLPRKIGINLAPFLNASTNAEEVNMSISSSMSDEQMDLAGTTEVQKKKRAPRVPKAPIKKAVANINKALLVKPRMMQTTSSLSGNSASSGNSATSGNSASSGNSSNSGTSTNSHVGQGNSVNQGHLKAAENTLEPALGTTQTVVPLLDHAKLRVPPMVVQKQHVTVRVLPPPKITVPEAPKPLVKVNEINQGSVIGNSPQRIQLKILPKSVVN
jgi:DNA polymerase III delta prime subunit